MPTGPLKPGDIHARLEDAEQGAHQLPHRENYLLIVVGFLRRLLDLHEELIDEVEGVLVTPSPAQSPARV
jgi:hypothetical protein